MNITVILAIIALLVTVTGLPVTLTNIRKARSERLTSKFSRTYEHARTRQSQLNSLTLTSINPEWQNAEIPMLTKPGWILSEPAPLESVELHWDGDRPPNDEYTHARERTRSLLPAQSSGNRYLSYSSAIINIAGMPNLFNGWVYRPIKIDATNGGLSLNFTSGRYFDHLDTTEILAYEAAMMNLSKKSITSGSYQRHLKDPFDLTRRSTCLGTVTLTIRVDHNGCGFYMHQRAGNGLVVAPESIHVVPAGEFTPADIGLESRAADFKLWNTIMREYAEEFLDAEEAYGKEGVPLDYENTSPYKDIISAREKGSLRLHVLGIGLDPLTWKPEILLACAIDAEVFDTLFENIVHKGKEGTILTGQHGLGIPFNKTNIETYSSNPNTRPAARSCLKLAWHHRASLNLT